MLDLVALSLSWTWRSQPAAKSCIFHESARLVDSRSREAIRYKTAPRPHAGAVPQPFMGKGGFLPLEDNAKLFRDRW